MNSTLRRTRLRLLTGISGAVALSVLAVAGCSSSPSSSSSSAASAASSSPAAAASAAAASSSGAVVPLVVYSAQGYDKVTTEAFTKATGIPVKLDDNSTGPLLTQIEASKNNPDWGLLWVDGATAFAGLDQQGLLMKNVIPSGISYNALGTASVPADKSYAPAGVTMMAAVVYNKAKVPNPPKTWQDLLSSSWTGQIGMNDPSQSGPTFPFIAGMMNYLGGVSAGESYFSKLKANGLIIHPTNGPTLQALTSGQINLALVQSSAGVGAVLQDKNLGITYLKGTTLLPSAIGIDAKASPQVQAEAEKFIQFVLSPAGQKVMQTGDPTGDSLYYPVIDGMNALPSVPALPSNVTQSIDPYKWGPQEATINTWFDSNIVR
jgi:iron(III) transport system substrate-binding protein